MRTSEQRRAPSNSSFWRRGFASLRLRLLLMIFVAVVPALVLVLYTAMEQRQNATLEAQDEALRLVRLAAIEQAQLIEEAHQLLMVLAQLPSLRDHDGVACSLLITELMQQYPQYGSLGVVDPTGNIFCSAIPADERVNLANRPYFPTMFQPTEFHVGEYLVPSSPGRAVLSVSYPVMDQTKQVKAVVYAGIDLNWFSQLVAKMRLPEGSIISVIDRYGTRIARYPDSQDWVGKPMPQPVVDTILGRQEGVDEGFGINAVPRLYAFASLGEASEPVAYVRVGIPKEVAFAQADWILKRNLIALAIAAGLSFLAGRLGADRVILRRMDAIIHCTERVSAGDLSVRTRVPYDGGDLSRLARAFDQMAGTLEQRDAEREQAKGQIQREAARAEAFVRMAHRLNAHLNLESVLNAVCEETARALSVRAASVCLFDENRNSLYRATDCGLPPEFREHWPPMSRESYEQYANKLGPVFVMSDPAAPPGLPNRGTDSPAPVREIAVAGMMREEQWVGILSALALGETEHFSEEDLMLLKGFADQAAEAIVNARLYVQVEEEGRARANLLHKTITVQEDERNRIARELHDETAHDLTLLMIELDLGLRTGTADLLAADSHFKKSRSVAEETHTKLRRIIADLRPSLLDDLGLLPAIRWYGEKRLKPLGISLEIQGDMLARRLPRPIETALFRISQEALSNAAKHANASCVHVCLEFQNAHLVMEIQDDGSGFLPPAVGTVHANGERLGLLGMKERTILLGGEFDLQTAPGQGTRIRVRVPLNEETRNV